MIVDTVRQDIFQTHHKHIAFAVNTAGVNDAGFAGQVASRFWAEIANTGGNELGETISHSIGDKTFHALVCHSFGENGWDRTPQMVQQCLDALDVPNDETIATVLIGSGFVGEMGGADAFAILGGMARSEKKIAIYVLPL